LSYERGSEENFIGTTVESVGADGGEGGGVEREEVSFYARIRQEENSLVESGCVIMFDEFDKSGEVGEYSAAAGAGGKGVNVDGSVKNPRRPGAFTSEKPTPYELSGLSLVDGSEEYVKSGDALHNDRAPHYGIKHQKPEHRIVILLKAQGNTNKEIANVTGLTPVSIANILRQPWARKQLVEEINSAGRNEVVQMFKGAALDVAERMIEIVNNPESRDSDKISAGHMILDRLFGKPNQPMEVNLNDSSLKSMSDEQLLKIATGNGSN
jgi:hypothetical protein